MPSAEALSRETWFDRAPCGLIATNPDGLVVDANATLAGWIGRDVEAVVGERFATLLDAGSRLIYETRLAHLLHLDGAIDEAVLTLAGADGAAVPVLVTASVDTSLEAAGEASVVRIALLPARERSAYERELARARRVAEASEARVRILQDISDAFGTSVNDQQVADTFVRVARDAFAASDAAVHLLDDHGRLQLVAGRDPLEGIVASIPSLQDTLVERALSIDDVETDFPELAEGLRAARLEALSVTPLRGESGRLGVLACFFGRARTFDDEFLDLQRALGRQASQTLTRVRLQRELEYQALRDPLTGVLNSQSVEQSLGEAVRAAADTDEAVSVLFMDVDAFKSINDTFGHVAGDHVLRTLARRLTESVRAHDIVGRIGGDEFVAICPGADAEVAAGIGERIRANARDAIQTLAGEVGVSVSIGLSCFDPASDRVPTADELLVRADGAMYVSKDAGKDRVSVENRSRPRA